MSKSELHQANNIAIEEKSLSDDILSESMAYAIAGAADDKKAQDIVLLKVSEVSYLADYFVVATGFSKPQLRAICDSIEQKVADDFEREPIRVEGKTDGRWVLIDYGEVIVHVFLAEEREFYNLEAFWGHAERIDYGVESTLNI
ncbi:iojap-like ribosome-associated protein [Xenococcus sp. PCC 7305]|uniref:ribosome silencing factor n=1 Tax=Xenococcus sp. PCC 7305 TaxID=102125 RepID=UPI0002ABBDF4|nr:ribosome silencing factor [Xenococcus sp. PCC 7305]ELS02623.1 iojap-like ribosome-associated protein [Xenococcus sp. PCC 7305]